MKKGIPILILSFALVLAFLEVFFWLTWNNHSWWIQPKRLPLYQYPIFKYGPGKMDYLRDFTYQKKKPDGIIRIACVGDSFTFGDGVKFDDTFAKRLERDLNYFNSKETGKKYEVLNISWCGTSTFQQINKLGFIRDFQPNLIIWGYCLNDTEDWANPDGVQALRQKTILIREPSNLMKWIYHHSCLLSFVGNRLSNIRIAWGNVQYYKAIYEDTYKGWQRTQESFRILGRPDIPIMVIIFPLLSYDLKERYPFLGIHQKVIQELKKNSIPFIDLYESLQNEHPLRLQAIPYGNPHPSEIAHRLIEEVIVEKISKDYKKILS